MRSRLISAWPALLLTALASAIALTRPLGLDYSATVYENNSAPAIDALLRGDFALAADVQPAVGAFSLLWRLPLAAFGGGDLLWQYRLGALACLLALVALAVVLDRRLAAARAHPLRRLVTAGLIVAGPAVFDVLLVGHPEELLGGALCVGATLAAIADRRVAAAILLGLAIGTKQWSLVAVAPVLLAVDGSRARVLLTAAAVAVLCTLPGMLADPGRYAEVSESLGTAARVYPQSLWWPIADEQLQRLAPAAGAALEVRLWSLPFGLDRSLASMVTLALAAAALLLALLPGRRVDPLALLAGLLVARCALDPMNLAYYFMPAALALACWDACRAPSRPWPLVAIAAAAATWLVWRPPFDPSPELAWALWATATLPFMAVAWPRRLASGRAQDRPTGGEPAAPQVAHQRPASISS